MTNAPKTIEEARKYKYGISIWSKMGDAFQEERCAWEFPNKGRPYQCFCKNGHGPGGLYCKQHAKIVEK